MNPNLIHSRLLALNEHVLDVVYVDSMHSRNEKSNCAKPGSFSLLRPSRLFSSIQLQNCFRASDGDSVESSRYIQLNMFPFSDQLHELEIDTALMVPPNDLIRTQITRYLEADLSQNLEALFSNWSR